MKKRSLKINFMLNVVRVISGAMVGVAVMPYVNRTLGVTALGRVEFAFSIINYFVLFSALGIPIYGVREIARARENLTERTKIFVELMVVLFITTFLSYLILFGVVFSFGKLVPYHHLLLLISMLIFLSNIGAEWYFLGIEDQLYITIRTVLVRLIGLGALFVFVKGPHDELAYATISLLILGGSNVFNILYVFRNIELKSVSLKSLNIHRHIRPVFTVFFAAISINIYLHLDKLLIGFIKGPDSVAYYLVANKIIRFVIEIVTMVGMVLLPRLSSLFISDIVVYKKYVSKAFSMIILLALPCTIFTFLFADKIIEIMAGPAFIPSVVAMKLLSPLCVVVGVAYYLGYLLLYTQNKEKIYTVAVMASAFFSISVNFFAIKYFDFNGAAVVAVLSEILAIVIMIVLMKKQVVTTTLRIKNNYKIVVINLLLLLIMFLFKRFIGIQLADLDMMWAFLVYTFSFFALYVLMLIFAAEDTVSGLLQNFRKLINI